MESISDTRYDSNYVTQLLLDIAHEQSLESLLQTFIRRAMAHPQVDLACIQVWLIDRGDLCSTCPQRPNCPDQTHCLHLVA
jgi:formate hydrogenlyase transcriptional activator